MAATKTGVWDLQEVRDKQLASEWSYYSSGDPGELWSWGYNTRGGLGLNTATTPSNNGISSPTQVGTDSNWMYVSNGDFALGLKSDSTLWAWGANWTGACGQNSINPFPSGGGLSSPTQIPGTWSENFSTFNERTLAIKSDNTLWTWGGNNKGANGLNIPISTYLSSPTQIPGSWSKAEAGYATGYCIKTNGELWSWGYNYYGALGINSATPGGTEAYSSPVQVGTNTNWASVGNGRPWCGFATKTDGTLWAWGYNNAGQLGQNEGPGNNYSSPVQLPGTNWKSLIGRGHASFGNDPVGAVKTDGTLRMWGSNEGGEIGDNSRTQRSSPVQVPGTTWDTVSFGYHNTMASKTDGTMWIWGSNELGQLGLNQAVAIIYSSPVQIPGTDWRTFGFSTSKRLSFGIKGT